MKNIKYFGRKFKIKYKHGTTPLEWKDTEFCLLGMCDNAIAFIEWNERGGYNFEYVTIGLDDIEFLD